MIYAVIPVLLAALCVWLGARLTTLLIILAYLLVEGFFKLVSGYNRVVHVGVDIVVLSLALWLVLKAVAERRAGLPRLPWLWLILMHAAWVALQVFNPYSAGLIPSLASFKIHLAMIPLYFIAAYVFRSTEDVRRFIAALALIAVVPSGFALLQYALGPASVLDLSPRYWQNISHYHEWRPFGTSAVPGGSAVAAFLVVPLAMVLVVAPAEERRRRNLALLSIVLAAGCFVVSGVRQVFLGCVLALLLMATVMALRGRGRALGALALVLALGAGAYVAVQTVLRPMATESIRRERDLPDIWREQDVTDRLLTLAEAGTYATARGNPLGAILLRAERYPFGAGLGRTGSAAGALQSQLARDPQSSRIQQEVGWSDNFFADMLVETGVPGAVMLTTLLLGLLFGALRLARRAADQTVAVTAAAIAGLFFAMLAMSWGSQPLLSNPITAFFWLLGGLLAALRRMDREMQAAAEAAAAPELAAPSAAAR